MDPGSEALNRDRRNQEKIARPLQDEQEKEKIDRLLQEALSSRRMIELSYYKDGFIKHKMGTLKNIDPIRGQIVINDAFGIRWKINFPDIFQIE